MKLSEVSEQVRTGDILMFRGSGPVAWLIKLKTRSVYSHCGIVIRIKANGTERVAVLEAAEPYGVRLYPLDQYLRAGAAVDWFQLVDPTINREAVAAYAVKRWGDRYAFKQLLYSFSYLARFVRWCIRRRHATEVDPRKTFCSALVAAALAHAGFRCDEDLIPLETDPGAVARFSCLQRKGSLEL